MIVIVDDGDCFAYNLAHLFGASGAPWAVVEKNRVDAAEILSSSPRAIVIGPGPGRPGPSDKGVALVQAAAGVVPLLGIGSGAQCIAVAFGGTVAPAPPMHGKPDDVVHDRRRLFAGLPSPFVAGRYDAGVVVEDGLPDELVVSARFRSGPVAGVRHRSLPVEALQFDPASVLTEKGWRIVQNFLAVAARSGGGVKERGNPNERSVAQTGVL